MKLKLLGLLICSSTSLFAQSLDKTNIALDRFIQEGIEKERRKQAEERKRMVEKLLDMGVMSLEEIATVVDLPLAEIERISKRNE